METYSILRQFADSWMLLLLFGFFVGMIFWVLRPGSTRKYEEPSTIPFRHEDRPAPVRIDAKDHDDAKET